MKLYFTPNSFQKKNSLIAFCKINKTYKKITKAKSQNLILVLCFGKKRNNENKNVLIETKINTILGKAPPYSSKILFPDAI